MGLPARPVHLGRYEVLAKIAGGGLSTVYLGRRKDDDDATPVALKIVRHDLRGDDDVMRMFLEEAELLPRLVHPGIVRTLEVGVGAETAFIAMELLLGVTLGQVLRTCATKGFGLHPEACAFIVARVADALHYAHEQGVIHRDANPENVFLGFDGTVKLIDFGLAKSEGRLTHSMPGVVKGKLPYLAPEQIMQLPIDRRTDVFTLATTFWEMLTMRRLFRRDTDDETLRAVHSGPIVDPCRLAPDVPFELGEIIMRALERNRDHRTPTADILAVQLDAFLHRRGVTDARPAIVATMDELFAFEADRQRGWLRPILTRSSRSRLASAG